MINRFKTLSRGIIDVSPLMIPVIPFGIIYGVIGMELGLGAYMTFGMSIIIFGGASQIVLLQLFSGGASSLVTITSVVAVNSRHLLYGAVFSEYLSHLKMTWKIILSYVLIDQAFAVSNTYFKENKKNEFIDLFVKKTKKLKIGNGMDPDTQLGPLTTQKRLNEVEALVEKTKQEGAKVLLGGKRPADFNKGFFYEPTIFDDVKDDFTIMKEEPFGPLVPMLSFKSFDEVIERANNHELGLCSYVCTNSMETAHLASEKLETGSVAVNTGFVAIAEAPFGGIKQSGYGREGGSNAIKDYLNVKYTHLGIKG